jgi:predicted anti-sigma-YlaC factor YlaD
MKTCPAWREELAVASTDGEAPSPAVAAHLRECAHCRDAYSTFRQVAGAHEDAASLLPNPDKPARLESWVQSQIIPQPRELTWPSAWRSLTAALATIALVAIAFSFLKSKNESIGGNETISKRVNVEISNATALANDRTWQSFRHEELMEERLSEKNPSQKPATITHYRLKDAYMAMQ